MLPFKMPVVSPSVVVLSHEFCVHLGDPVDGFGPLHSHVGSRIARGLGTEGADRRGNEDLRKRIIDQSLTFLNGLQFPYGSSP